MINQILEGDSAFLLTQIENGSIDLTVTSPPYNVGRDYEKHNDSLAETDYFELIRRVFKEVYRVTKPGGRLCLNVPFTANSWFKKQTDSLCFYPIEYVNLCSEAGWQFRDYVVWVKTREPGNPDSFCGNSTAWGSWLSPSCPYLRCFCEAILVFHKEFKKLQHQGKSDLTKEEFLEYTKNVWFFPAETNRKHPAPFPVELPRRCIKLYSYVEDVVLDPFLGSGTTAVAAKELGRRFIGIEINPRYVKIAHERLASRIIRELEG